MWAPILNPRRILRCNFTTIIGPGDPSTHPTTNKTMAPIDPVLGHYRVTTGATNKTTAPTNPVLCVLKKCQSIDIDGTIPYWGTVFAGITSIEDIRLSPLRWLRNLLQTKLRPLRSLQTKLRALRTGYRTLHSPLRSLQTKLRPLRSLQTKLQPLRTR